MEFARALAVVVVGAASLSLLAQQPVASIAPTPLATEPQIATSFAAAGAVMNLVSESLLREGRAKDAAAIMELNSEVNSPLTKWGFSCLAMAHQANKEKQKAELDFERILELDPKNEWAAGQLTALRVGTQPQ